MGYKSTYNWLIVLGAHLVSKMQIHVVSHCSLISLLWILMGRSINFPVRMTAKNILGDIFP